MLRLDDGLTPQDRRVEFESLGLRIEKTLSYAPNAAWLCPAHGGPGEALQLLSEVEKVPGVVHCEPQMLMQRTARKG